MCSNIIYKGNNKYAYMPMQIPATSLRPLCGCLIATVTDPSLADSELSSVELLFPFAAPPCYTTAGLTTENMTVFSYIYIYLQSLCRDLVLNVEHITGLVAVWICIELLPICTYRFGCLEW
jgi:hypothetical protein